jgi:hypothetical protein
MVQRCSSNVVHQPRVSRVIMARFLLLASSGAVRKFEKATLMTRVRKQMAKWGLSAAKLALATSIVVAPAVSALASECNRLELGALVWCGLEQSSSVCFGVGKPLRDSASPTTGNSRTANRNAPEQVLLGEGLKGDHETLNASVMCNYVSVPGERFSEELQSCRTAYQTAGWHFGRMPKFDDCATDDRIQITGFKTLYRSEREEQVTYTRLFEFFCMRDAKLRAHVPA